MWLSFHDSQNGPITWVPATLLWVTTIVGQKEAKEGGTLLSVGSVVLFFFRVMCLPACIFLLCFCLAFHFILFGVYYFCLFLFETPAEGVTGGVLPMCSACWSISDTFCADPIVSYTDGFCYHYLFSILRLSYSGSLIIYRTDRLFSSFFVYWMVIH